MFVVGSLAEPYVFRNDYEGTVSAFILITQFFAIKLNLHAFHLCRFFSLRVLLATRVNGKSMRAIYTNHSVRSSSIQIP